MQEFLDEISLWYWQQHYERLGNKSFACVHNGYVYGDGMREDELGNDISFVYEPQGGASVVCHDATYRQTYYRFVEQACNLSEETFRRFRTRDAEKYRLYTAAEAGALTETKRHSLRIRPGQNPLNIRGQVYYAAANLKICEFLYNAAESVAPAELAAWHIRLIDRMGAPAREKDIEQNVRQAGRLTLVVDAEQMKEETRRAGGYASRKVDFAALNAAKKQIGDLGELAVLAYEQARLRAIGRPDLAERVRHVATRDDTLGYDIASFTAEGEPLCIEVKTTARDVQGHFFLSAHEQAVASACARQGRAYCVYRVYQLDDKNGQGRLKIYEPPFEEPAYAIHAQNMLVKGERRLRDRELCRESMLTVPAAWQTAALRASRPLPPAVQADVNAVEETYCLAGFSLQKAQTFLYDADMERLGESLLVAALLHYATCQRLTEDLLARACGAAAEGPHGRSALHGKALCQRLRQRQGAEVADAWQAMRDTAGWRTLHFLWQQYQRQGAAALHYAATEQDTALRGRGEYVAEGITAEDMVHMLYTCHRLFREVFQQVLVYLGAEGKRL